MTDLASVVRIWRTKTLLLSHVLALNWKQQVTGETNSSMPI